MRFSVVNMLLLCALGHACPARDELEAQLKEEVKAVHRDWQDAKDALERQKDIVRQLQAAKDTSRSELCVAVLSAHRPRLMYRPL